MEKKKVPVRLYKKTDASAEYEVPVEMDVVRWFSREGDTVRAGDELCELEAEKGSFSMEAPCDGTLVDIRYPATPTSPKIWKRGKPEQSGDTLFYDPPLCFVAVEIEGTIATDASAGKKLKPKISAKAIRTMQELGLNMEDVLAFFTEKSRIEKTDVLDYHTRTEGERNRSRKPPEKTPNQMPQAVPRARERARELDIDLLRIQGTGPDGEILVSDVEHYGGRAKSETDEIMRLATPRLWRTIAKNVEEGARIPTSDADMRFDFSLLIRFYRTHSSRFPYALWFPLVVALARTLAVPEFVLFNSYWDSENEEKPVVIRKAVHMGLSYDRGEVPKINLAEGRIEGERLKILVVRDTQKKTLRELLDETRKLLDAAEAKKMPLELLSGYTFICNNIGVLGHERGRSLLSGKISTMVNLGRIDFSSGRGVLQIVFDHRLIDGAQTPPFLKAVYQEMSERVIPELIAFLTP